MTCSPIMRFRQSSTRRTNDGCKARRAAFAAGTTARVLLPAWRRPSPLSGALFVQQRADQRPAQRLSRRFHQHHGMLAAGATSTSVSRMVPRSRIETCSRSSCCRTFCTSPSDINLGTSSSSSFGWLSLSRSISRLFRAGRATRARVLDQLGQVRRQHRGLIHDRISGRDGLPWVCAVIHLAGTSKAGSRVSWPGSWARWHWN